MSDEQHVPPERPEGTREGATRRRLSAQRMGAAAPIQPKFSQPIRQILLMVIVLALVGAGGWFAYGRIYSIFAANPVLNGIILGVFVVGVLACFLQVAQLVGSVIWIERFAEARANAAAAGIAAQGEEVGAAPRLLAPLAAILGGRGPVGGAISPGSARSILESVATRIDEARDITRYISNLLIFLGLLGTFYGLATTVPAVVETIRALAPQEGDTGLEVFERLMSGLEAQLGGMATAFSSSLLGLAGSLVVGLLELFVTHGQNRFYRELEEWMSSFTRIGVAGDDGERVDQVGLAGFLDRMAGHMQVMQDFYLERDALREEEVIEADARLGALARDAAQIADAVARDGSILAEHHERTSAAIAALADGQARLSELAEARAHADAAPQDDPVAVLRSIDASLAELAERGRSEAAEAAPQRLESIDRSLARLVAVSEEGPDQEAPIRLRSIDESLIYLASRAEQMAARPAGQGADEELLAALGMIEQSLARLVAQGEAQADIYDSGDDGAEARMRLRSIDVTLGRLVEEIAASRQEMMAELRGDIAHLTKSVQRLGGGY
ncbi:MAG: hypothetical protein Q4F71_07060 [Paracoccus sp. (in: a-proteobacteria)]|nr:hypothetical protein [Paracoccus sp. (in: a-proteobacteria)]